MWGCMGSWVCGAQAKVPIQLIWGKEDRSVPYTQCCRLRGIAEEIGTPVWETSFEGMPHNVFYPTARQQECSQAICEFGSGRLVESG